MRNQSFLYVVFSNNLLRFQSQELKSKWFSDLQGIRIMTFHCRQRHHFLRVSAYSCTNIKVGTNLSTQFTNRPSTLDTLLLIEIASKRVALRHYFDNVRKRQP